MNRMPNSGAGIPIRLFALALLGGASATPLAGQAGGDLFRGSCAACHTIGGGRLVGPDLMGVDERRSEDWIIAFVQHSQAVIASGDSVAVALSEKYPGIMPDWPLSGDEVRSVLAYIRERGSAVGATTSSAQPAPIQEATPEQVLHGRALFQGTTRLTNGGPSCNSCHEVAHDAVIGGGVLAVELTTAFSRLGGAGVRAIIGSPPFPVMQRAYQNRPLTAEEVTALVGFLRQADAEQALHQPRDYGLRLLSAGLAGAALLLGLYTLTWRRRKKGSVHQAIYHRQATST